MAKLDGDNIGAQGKDGIIAKVGITYLPTNRTILMMPLEENCPTDPEEMVIEGEAVYSLDKMFQRVQPKVDVSLSTGDEANPLQDFELKFSSLRDYEPDAIVDNVPLLRSLKEKQQLISRLEMLMQEGSFKKILDDKDKKEALVAFLRSVIADIEAGEKE